MTIAIIMESNVPMAYRLTTVEVIHQTIGSTSSMRLQLSALACDECGAIPWDELQVSSFKIHGSEVSTFIVYSNIYMFGLLSYKLADNTNNICLNNLRGAM